MKKKFDYTIFNDYEYESEEEEKETDKKPNKKEPPKKPTENSVKELKRKLANKEETDMNWGLFPKHFKFTKPSALLKELYRIKSKKKKKLVDLIKSGLKDLKDEIKEMSENKIEIERPDKMVDLVQGIIEFHRQN